MRYIGCTSFSEHESLIQKKSATLYDYARFFPIVEMDTSFYATPSRQRIEIWIEQVPKSFRFVMKIHQAFTKQTNIEMHQSLEEMATEFCSNLEPMIASEQLYCLLAQFPASFKCTRENVAYLETVCYLFQNLPLAIEFRDYSWYDAKNINAMHQFMQKQKVSLVIVDEPKHLPTTVPFEETVTNAAFVLIRLHGRNDLGWLSTGPNARALRTNYCYNETELESFKQSVNQLTQKAKNVAIIFNNNAGGDAAKNASQLQEMLALEFTDLNPQQLRLF